MKLGMIGCGAIGSDVAKAANDMEEIEEIYVYDIDEEKGKKLAQQLKKIHFKKDFKNRSAKSIFKF